MIWVDREAKKIKERKSRLEWVDDMKTPSGRIHVGALRGVVIHDLVYRALLNEGIAAKNTYVFDDHDPMDAIPAYLEESKWRKYAGMQLFKVPSPQKGFKSFAEFYAQEFQSVFESINCHPEIIWASYLYNSGKMNGVIKEVLDQADKVREIFNRMFENKKGADWYPFQAVCKKCQKIGTTYVYKWDGENVYYRCEPQLVKWAKGCGYKGKVSPFDGNGKLNWRVDWPAKWKVIGITIEGAGKDHMSAGGSYDMAVAVCREILNYPPTYPLSYEWFTIGGKKMSSSKGIGTSAKEITEILPPEVLRFLIVRTPIQTALDFDPYGDTILNLFDDYDRCMNAYFDKLENKIPDGKPGEVLSDFARITELSEVRPLPDKRLFLPRFRTIANLIKTKADLLNHFETQKGKSLTADEKEILEEREVFAQKYLSEYAESSEETAQQPIKVSLNNQQKKFLAELADAISKQEKSDRDTIQDIIFDVLKKGKYKAGDVFPAFYKVITGQESGPKAADLILSLGVAKAVKQLKVYLNSPSGR